MCGDRGLELSTYHVVGHTSGDTCLERCFHMSESMEYVASVS